MQFYPMDHVIERTLENHLSREQWLLKQFSGRRFRQNEAALVWSRILDHKWHISERLGRDVGLKVAVLDFLENIHEPRISRRRENTWLGRLMPRNAERASLFA